jgi:two-component system, chemotaxis family, chemotaxis protein CheY
MLEQKNILVIEDEDDVREVLAKRLRTVGYQVEAASNGLEALEKLKVFTPNLIILDLNMPKMGGVEFYQTICGVDTKPKFPVFVVTARANMEDFFKDFEVVGFKVKPFEIHQLLKEVRLVLDRKKQLIKQIEELGDVSRRFVHIIDSDQNELEKIRKTFKDFGYQVTTSHSGVQALEQIMDSPPDMVMVNLSLEDIPGDLFILKMHQFVKTEAVIGVLYAHRNYERKTAVLENIQKKSGVRVLQEYTEPVELLDAVNLIFKEVQKDKLEQEKW